MLLILLNLIKKYNVEIYIINLEIYYNYKYYILLLILKAKFLTFLYKD